ncbi:hypothetical protein, partial [Escherichia coli]|uniref:hypothetical protein n=1 Tax=Escherichia coli TaxID=562 RepID=UPI0019678F91
SASAGRTRAAHDGRPTVTHHDRAPLTAEISVTRRDLTVKRSDYPVIYWGKRIYHYAMRCDRRHKKS